MKNLTLVLVVAFSILLVVDDGVPQVKCHHFFKHKLAWLVDLCALPTLWVLTDGVPGAYSKYINHIWARYDEDDYDSQWKYADHIGVVK